MFIFIGFVNFFQTDGPIYDRLFFPMLVLQKGTLSLAQLFLKVVLTCEACSKTSFMYKGHPLLTYLKTVTFKALLYSLINGQSIVLKFSSERWFIMSSFRRKRIHFFCIICSFFKLYIKIRVLHCLRLNIQQLNIEYSKNSKKKKIIKINRDFSQTPKQIHTKFKMERNSLQSYKVSLAFPVKCFLFVDQIWHYKELNQYSMVQKIRFMLLTDFQTNL